MAWKITGFEEESGNYEGINYHNVNLYLEQMCNSRSGGKSAGIKTFKAKVKWGVVEEFLKASKMELDYLCGIRIDCDYDQYKNVKRLIEIK